jgi:hypothetical protein
MDCAMRVVAILFFSVLFFCPLSFGQDSLNVRRVGSGPYLSNPLGVAVSGNYAYIADYDRGLRVINIANPALPAEVGYYVTPNYATSVAVAGNYAYVTSGRLRVIDVADPTHPTEVGVYDDTTAGAAHCVALAGNYAYVAKANPTSLQVVNISNPSSPVVVGTCFITIYGGWDVVVAGNYAYMTAANSEGWGLRVIDIANSSSPVEIGTCNMPPDVTRGLAVSGNYAYVSNESRLRVINIANPTAPTPVGFYTTPSTALGVAVQGNYAYVADNIGGLRVINIADPAAPVEVGFYSQWSAYRVAVAGNYAYVANSGIFSIYDCSEATSVHESSILQPSSFNLSSYPNPFNAVTRLQFNLARTGQVDLKVFDLNGRLVETLASKTFNAGEHEVTFDGKNLATGMYLARLRSGSLNVTQKIVLLK